MPEVDRDRATAGEIDRRIGSRRDQSIQGASLLARERGSGHASSRARSAPRQKHHVRRLISG